MNQKDFQLFKKQLIQMRKDLVGQIDHIKENDIHESSKDASGDHSAYSFHMADQGTDNMEREKNFFYVQRDGYLLQDIEEALARIENGTFGQCIECGEVIQRPRLEAMPYANLCLDCKSKEEQISRINPFAAGEEY